MDMEIPKLRKGGYMLFFLEKWQRSEQALVTGVVEVYRNGVSTRRIRHLAQSLGVSEMNRSLDGMVESFRTGSLKSE